MGRRNDMRAGAHKSLQHQGDGCGPRIGQQGFVRSLQGRKHRLDLTHIRVAPPGQRLALLRRLVELEDRGLDDGRRHGAGGIKGSSGMDGGGGGPPDVSVHDVLRISPFLIGQWRDLLSPDEYDRQCHQCHNHQKNDAP